jgi:hypothetical protein
MRATLGIGALGALAAARTFEIAGFTPAPVVPGKSERISFFIRQPSGEPLTQYRRGAGPHTGVHLIIVRDDLSTIIHRHPPMGANGRFSQPITFPAAGRYRMVVDAYPSHAALPTQTNFQLFRWLQVGRGDPKETLPSSDKALTVDGYRFKLTGGSNLKALKADLMHATVTKPDGKPATFIPYYGALAHAIFFRRGSLDYIHTHVCGPNTPGCTTALGAIKVRGTSTKPGQLNIGMVVPLPGTWRMFLQTQVAPGKVVTAPFTLHVK